MNVLRAAPVTCIQSHLCDELSGSFRDREHLRMQGCEMLWAVFRRANWHQEMWRAIFPPDGFEPATWNRELQLLTIFFVPPPPFNPSLNSLSKVNSICKCCLRMECRWEQACQISLLSTQRHSNKLGWVKFNWLHGADEAQRCVLISELTVILASWMSMWSVCMCSWREGAAANGRRAAVQTEPDKAEFVLSLSGSLSWTETGVHRKGGVCPQGFKHQLTE